MADLLTTQIQTRFDKLAADRRLVLQASIGHWREFMSPADMVELAAYVERRYQGIEEGVPPALASALQRMLDDPFGCELFINELVLTAAMQRLQQLQGAVVDQDVWGDVFGSIDLDREE